MNRVVSSPLIVVKVTLLHKVIAHSHFLPASWGYFRQGKGAYFVLFRLIVLIKNHLKLWLRRGGSVEGMDLLLLDSGSPTEKQQDTHAAEC